MSRVLVSLACGFEEIEAATIVDILRRGDLEVVVASLDENLLVEGAHRLSIRADRELESVNTSKGPATAMEFALEIVKKLKGEAKYMELKKALLVL